MKVSKIFDFISSGFEFSGKDSEDEKLEREYDRFLKVLKTNGIKKGTLKRGLFSEAVIRYHEINQVMDSFHDIPDNYKACIRDKAYSGTNSMDGDNDIFIELFSLRDAAADLAGALEPDYIRIDKSIRQMTEDAISQEQKRALGENARWIMFLLTARRVISKNLNAEDREIYHSYSAILNFIEEVNNLEEYEKSLFKEKYGPDLRNFYIRILADRLPCKERSGPEAAEPEISSDHLHSKSSHGKCPVRLTMP